MVEIVAFPSTWCPAATCLGVVGLLGRSAGATVAQDPGRKVRQRYRGQCGTEVPSFHTCEVSPPVSHFGFGRYVSQSGLSGLAVGLS